MASSCPIETSKSWKTLHKQVGDDLAWTTWEHYDGYPPTLKNTTALKRELGVPSKASPTQVMSLAKRVRQYNTRNGTSHSFTQMWIGQSNTAAIEFTPNYLPVNIERRRQRDFQRSEKDKSYYDFTSPAVEGVPKEAGERSFDELTEEEKIAATSIEAPLTQKHTMEVAKMRDAGLTKNNMVTALTEEFKEWFGDSIPTNEEVEMFRMGKPEQLELFVPEVTDQPINQPEVKPVVDKTKAFSSNMTEATKEGVLPGDFVSMDETEFDQLFPEYDWMEPLQKQRILRQLMNANIKLTCGL